MKREEIALQILLGCLGKLMWEAEDAEKIAKAYNTILKTIEVSEDREDLNLTDEQVVKELEKTLAEIKRLTGVKRKSPD